MSDESSGPTAEAGAVRGGLIDEIRTAAMFLTRLPFAGERPPLSALSGAARAFPLVGAGVGLAGGAVYAAAVSLGLPPVGGALLALAVTIGVTGALHEDGLADVADGFGGGADAKKKLAIMRDSRIGSYAVLALVLGIGLRATALASIDGAIAAAGALIGAAAGSRGALPLIMELFPQARRSGMAAEAGRPAHDQAIIAAVIGGLFVLLFFGPLAGAVAILAGGGAAWGMAALAKRQIGGITGDVLGAAQQLAEIAILLTAAATMTAAT